MSLLDPYFHLNILKSLKCILNIIKLEDDIH